MEGSLATLCDCFSFLSKLLPEVVLSLPSLHSASGTQHKQLTKAQQHKKTDAGFVGRQKLIFKRKKSFKNSNAASFLQFFSPVGGKLSGHEVL